MEEIKATPKQRAFAEAYLEAQKSPSNAPNRTVKDIAMSVGYSLSSATEKPERLVSSNPILQAKLQEYGFTQEKVAKVIEEAANANVVSVFHGEVTESDVADHKVRMQAVSLLGDFTGTKKSTIEKKVVNINVDSGDLDRILS